jgi:cellulose synthase/poly-beta-1,6-N-acetylglucosamine synthase-like glycosyltransferase
VVLLNYRERRGKASVLNSSFPELKGEIVLLSDANTQIDPSALRKLVRWFQYADVGVVCGRLILTDSRTGRNVDGLYWRYETFLKRCDGRLGALLGANGAIYAIRHKLFTPVPPETILDDLLIPLQAKLRTGCAMIYDCEAVAREETSPDVRSEFHRRARIGAGGFQSIRMLWRLLDPRRGWIAFTFLSHKIGRWISPFCLLGVLTGNLFLLTQPFYRSTMATQLTFYLVALLVARLPGQAMPLRLLRLSTMFTLMNAALFVGFCRWVRGSQKAAWQRTKRSAEPDIALSRPGL